MFLGCKLLLYLSINQMRQVDQVIVQWSMLEAGAKYKIRHFSLLGEINEHLLYGA